MFAIMFALFSFPARMRLFMWPFLAISFLSIFLLAWLMVLILIVLRYALGFRV